jgi:hypothetical protein
MRIAEEFGNDSQKVGLTSPTLLPMLMLRLCLAGREAQVIAGLRRKIYVWPSV